jgi:hypothetical protein
MPPLIVVLDGYVLVPASLRDTFNLLQDSEQQ